MMDIIQRLNKVHVLHVQQVVHVIVHQQQLALVLVITVWKETVLAMLVLWDTSVQVQNWLLRNVRVEQQQKEKQGKLIAHLVLLIVLVLIPPLTQHPVLLEATYLLVQHHVYLVLLESAVLVMW